MFNFCSNYNILKQQLKNIFQVTVLKHIPMVLSHFYSVTPIHILHRLHILSTYSDIYIMLFAIDSLYIYEQE